MVAKHAEGLHYLGSDITVLPEGIGYAGNESRIVHSLFGEDIQGYLSDFL